MDDRRMWKELDLSWEKQSWEEEGSKTEEKEGDNLIDVCSYSEQQ